jgi:hypothetical protein
MPVIETPAMPGVEIAREGTRKYMAYGALGGFLGLLALIVFVGWIMLKLPIEDVLKVLSTTAGVLSGVVGAVVGFYFRGEDK